METHCGGTIIDHINKEKSEKCNTLHLSLKKLVKKIQLVILPIR